MIVKQKVVALPLITVCRTGTFMLVLATAVLFAACSTPKQAPKAPAEPQNFGIWQFFADSCRLYANRANIHLSTDGKMSNDKLYIKLSADVPLRRTPDVRFSNLNNLTFPLEGTERHFSFEVPYVPTTSAKMLDDKSFIIVTYHPTKSNRPVQAYFSTRELPHALAYWGEHCGA